jgi:hypothetical protein
VVLHRKYGGVGASFGVLRASLVTGNWRIRKDGANRLVGGFTPLAERCPCVRPPRAECGDPQKLGYAILCYCLSSQS